MSSEYIWTEVWLVDADIPSYLMQILARADGTYELHDPQKQDVVRRSTGPSQTNCPKTNIAASSDPVTTIRITTPISEKGRPNRRA